MSDLKIIFFGTPDFVIPLVETLQKNFKLTAVVTTPDMPSGRNQTLTPSAVAMAVKTWDLEILKPSQLNDSLINQLTNLQPDLFVVASYGKIIPQSILDIPKLGSINIHPSKLPEYRGASPIQSQILNGVSDSAISFILMDSEMDHGPILHIEDFQIKGSDTFESLHYSMFKKASEILPMIIDMFAKNELTPIEQNHNNTTYCGHIKREDGYFDITNPPDRLKLDRMIRAYYPWPTAWTRWNGKIVKFLPEGKIQMEGKNPVTKKEFLNGYPDFPDTL